MSGKNQGQSKQQQPSKQKMASVQPPPKKDKRTHSDVSNDSAENSLDGTVIQSQLDSICSDIGDLKMSVNAVLKRDEVEALITSTIKKIVGDLEKSLTQKLETKFTEKTRALQDRINVLEYDNKQLIDKVEKIENETKKKIHELSASGVENERRSKDAVKRANYNEQYSRKNNFKIANVQEVKYETQDQLEAKVNEILKKHDIALEKSEILAIHRIPSKRSEIKPVLIKTINNEAKLRVMKKRKVMKNDGHKVHPQPVRQKYRTYSPSALTNAYKMVKEEGITVYRASRMFNVPERTLRDRFLGRVDPDLCVMGKLPLFDQYEEAKLVNHFKRMADLGYGYTQQECVDVASEFAIELGKRTKDKPLSIKWMKGFLGRWPEMRVIKPRGLEHVRAKMASESVVMSYFDNLEHCIQKNGLHDKPHLIYNIDEKGVSIQHKPPHIVASAANPAQAVTSGKGNTVTILGAGSASGSAIPPYFVFPGKKMNYDLLQGGSPGVNGTVSDSGWSTMAVFHKYLTEHFINFIPGRGDDKVLLLLDGHRSHVALTLANWARQNNIILFILPAHTSHILQPLDVGCYGPFQKMYHIQVHKYIRQTHAAITKYNICEIACKVYHRALCAENLQSAFRKTGIYPTDRGAIPKSCMNPSEVFMLDDSDNNSQSSSATVEGGLQVNDIFEVKEQQLVSVKNEKPCKPRRTVSKLVSGKELTSEPVIDAIDKHEQSMKNKKPLKSSQTRKFKGSEMSSSQINISENPQPGPSHINLVPDTPSSDESDTDDDKCCVCGRFQTKEQAACVSLTFVKWGQCDGIRNGRPCLHWTHLGNCTPVRVLRRGDEFFCPYCKKSEE